MAIAEAAAEAVAETFKALGDPIRLEMVRRLSSGLPYTVGSISSDLGITRQGARKHLQVLTEAHVIILEVKGRETQVWLDPKSLDAARSFIAELEQQWDRRLAALRDFAEQNPDASTPPDATTISK